MTPPAPSARAPREPCGPAVRRRLLAVFVAAALAAQPLGPATLGTGGAHAQTPTQAPPDLAPRPLGATALGPGAAHAQTQTQGLPDLGDESQSMLSGAQERKLGESVVRQIRASGAYLDDPEVNDYLNELGHRLVAAVPEGRQDFEFFAVGDPSINAFALP